MVRLIRQQQNLGFAQGCNVGAEAATGHYLTFINPDTVVTPGWLDHLIDALTTDPQAGLSTPKILLFKEPDTINTCGNQMHYTGLTLCRGAGQPKSILPHSGKVDAVSGAAFVISRELFAALNGFDPHFFTYMEDTDLSWRARLAGYHCLYVPESIVYHDYALHFGPQKTFFQERNRYTILLKSLSWRTLLALLPALILAEIITWGFVLVRERQNFSNKLQAYRWIAEHWPEIITRRQQTLASKKISDRDLMRQCTHRLAYEQTGRGPIAQVAHKVFDPLFYAWQRVALAVIR
jgi:GT2 family glycosyltransferase